MRLSDVADGRDNNLNLLRLCAAACVLIQHGLALSHGSGAVAPLTDWIGMSLGTIAVDTFFVISGFLVTSSMFRRQGVWDFAVSRALRIFPALSAVVVLCVFVLGPLLTSLPLNRYFAAAETWQYLWKNLTLFGGVLHTLPGVFEANPWPRAVNGSLWTMPYEVRLYAALAVLWIVAGSSRRRPQLTSFALVVTAVACGALLITHAYEGTRPSAGLRLTFAFFSGAAYFVCRKVVRLSTRVVVLLLVSLALVSPSRQDFPAVYVLSLTYLVMWGAYVPGGRLRTYNRLGDYSFGVYIYSFPIQQTCIVLIPGLESAWVVLLSGLLTGGFAVASWHLIESPALRLRPGVAPARRVSALPASDSLGASS